jgi:hypothetical protein
MRKILFTVLLIVISLTSCKNDKVESDPKTDSKLEEKDQNLFKVNFELIVKKNDNMHLYYTDDETLNFNEKQSIWMPVKGSESVQNVQFNLPLDVIPTHIRVDFGYGKNIEQSDVELKTFRMSYFGEKVEAKGIDILNYFYPMKENTEAISGTSTLKRLNRDQETGPVLYPHILLSQKIKEITKGIK